MSLLKDNTKQLYLKTAKILRKFDVLIKNPYFNSVNKPKNTQVRYQMFYLDININCIFSYHNIDHKWVLYLYGDNEPCFKRLYRRSL